MKAKPLVLVTNDDGIGAPGLLALETALAPIAELWVVAPERERSAASQAISIHRPLRVHEDGQHRFFLDGTPVDCVYVAIHHLLPRTPDLAISGINRGANLGTDVIYSGTVAAAREAALRSVPAMAISLRAGTDFEPAAEHGRILAERMLGGPRPLLVNVNVPAGEIRGHRITTLGLRVYKDEVERRVDPRGRPYYWIGGPGMHVEDVGGSDAKAVQEGYVSITPLALDQTDHGALESAEALLGGGR